jgi:glycosyltransferase involved in cell wall biosynthesis
MRSIWEGQQGRSHRVLVFVVAYEAADKLASVLERITAGDIAYEVLVIDDASTDRTFEVALESADSHPLDVTVFATPENQGYGGNQKLGYAYAIRNDFDFVVLLHGDGQYAPEKIPELLAPLRSGDADAVFGSRMMDKGAAVAGGMPLYKFVGNKILSRIQNGLLRTSLSEFHSGFRAYSVSALRKIPFHQNANGFHFDTEIIIQLLLAGCRISEVPIPTYYGDEICRVNGIPYAWNVIKATLKSRLHALGIFYDRRFDIDGPGNSHYTLKLGYRSSHTAAIEIVPEGSRVLDIGCGPGEMAMALREKGCSVDGVDPYEPVDQSVFSEFRLWNDSEPLPFDLRRYSWVLLLDVIEHMSNPEGFLDKLRSASRSLDGNPRLLITTGNVVFWIVRFQALLGNFNYGKKGILDLTHTRLFTFSSLKNLLEGCGYEIERIEGVPAPFPLALGLNPFARALVKLNQSLIRISKGLFSYQILVVASPKPTVDALLDRTIEKSAERSRDAIRHESSAVRARDVG